MSEIFIYDKNKNAFYSINKTHHISCFDDAVFYLKAIDAICDVNDCKSVGGDLKLLKKYEFKYIIKGFFIFKPKLPVYLKLLQNIKILPDTILLMEKASSVILPTVLTKEIVKDDFDTDTVSKIIYNNYSIYVADSDFENTIDLFTDKRHYKYLVINNKIKKFNMIGE